MEIALENVRTAAAEKAGTISPLTHVVFTDYAEKGFDYLLAETDKLMTTGAGEAEATVAFALVDTVERLRESDVKMHQTRFSFSNAALSSNAKWVCWKYETWMTYVRLMCKTQDGQGVPASD